MSTEPKTVPAKYIFLDVVDFSRDRSVEAQSHIVAFLNIIVRKSLLKHDIDDEHLLLLPTGDGICIALLNIVEPYDIHLQLALSILQYIIKFRGVAPEAINEEDDDRLDVEVVLVSDEREYLRSYEMRSFQIRIGIEANIDNLVIDINGRQNIAGAGINMAQRVMGLADGGQILVGQSVFNELRYREKYMDSFRALPATKVKHGTLLQVHQFVGKDHEGLNTEYPEALKPPKREEPEEPKLTKIAAYYFAHAIRQRKFLLEKYDASYSPEGVALLWMLAQDSVKKSEAITEAESRYYESHSRIKETLEDLLRQIESTNFTILGAARDHILSTVLDGSAGFFEGYDEYMFVTQHGREKLKQDWPQIWTELEFDGFTEKPARPIFDAVLDALKEK